MKILVCISHVPDTTTKIKFVNDKLDTNGVQFIIGPYDDYALSKAVDLKSEKNATVTVLNVGKPETEPTLRKALAIGADEAIRIDADPIDAYFVAVQIAEFAKQNQYDLILMGRESVDFNGGLVHGFVGEMLGIPSLSPCMSLEFVGERTVRATREIEGGKETLELELPFVAGCQEPIAEWKIPNMRGIMTAKNKPLKVISAISVENVLVHRNFSLVPERSACKMISVEELAELIKKF
ncbi:MAG: electron transfer flavoprotein subunit beta/FixA family protein [Cytophagales bacterium]|nr:electron transfer flavoprotein subunit beta/FixA family protein [Cytophagales bacterium]MDW8384222.1 electron transfer flavoprotein subunit beta/FixA family protein [Flammeovirgaceae bacterium]